MTSDDAKPGKPAQPATDREARLKAALKANLQRRKAQARARASEDETHKPDDTGEQA
jgi:hypothetical protein